MGALETTMPALSEAAGGFTPAEDLFDPSAGLLAEGVRIRTDAHAQGSALRTGRRMRSHTAIADALDKPAGTVAAIGTEGTRIKSAFLQLFDLLTATVASGAPTAGRTSKRTQSPFLFSIVA